MFLLVLLVLVAGVTAQKQTRVGFGPMWGWYSVRTNAHIISAETTLYPNAPPSPALTRLALWPGMNVAKGLIQPAIISSDEPLFQGPQCGGAKRSDWCVFASMLSGRQRAGKRVALDAQGALNMKFQYNETLDGYSQWLYIKGKMVSELHLASGKARSYYVAAECQEKNCEGATINNHTYKDTTLVFSEPVPNLDKQATLHYMACADSITTPDGGKTWNIKSINVQKSKTPEQYGKTAKMPALGGTCGR